MVGRSSRDPSRRIFLTGALQSLVPCSARRRSLWEAISPPPLPCAQVQRSHCTPLQLSELARPRPDHWNRATTSASLLVSRCAEWFPSSFLYHSVIQIPLWSCRPNQSTLPTSPSTTVVAPPPPTVSSAPFRHHSPSV
jgi:hypothetical protein